MEQWWAGLGIYNQVLFVIAASMTVFMLLQLVSLLLGTVLPDSSLDLDGDIGDINDGAAFELFGLQLFNLRTATTFLCIGSWSIFTFNAMMHVAIATILGVICGAIAAVLIAYAMKGMMSIQASGNFRIENAVGKNGEVYLPIPPGRTGAGKVQVVMVDRCEELDAMTESEQPLPTGTPVVVVAKLADSMVLVRPLVAAAAATTELKA